MLFYEIFIDLFFLLYGLQIFSCSCCTVPCTKGCVIGRMHAMSFGRFFEQMSTAVYNQTVVVEIIYLKVVAS